MPRNAGLIITGLLAAVTADILYFRFIRLILPKRLFTE